MPNITIRDTGGYRILPWASLTRRLFEELEGTEPGWAAAYATLWEDGKLAQGWLERTVETFRIHGFTLDTRLAKDVDSWIVNDIWSTVVWHQQRLIHTEQKLSFPLKMRHVLVSGDGGYLRAYQSLARVYGPDELELQLIVCSWRDSLSRELLEYADTVILLDDLVR